MRLGRVLIRGRGRGRGSVVLIVLGTAVLGAALAVVKGRGYGPGYFVGNLSVPYLVAAFVAGRMVQRRWTACVVGLLATWATLIGFAASAASVFGSPTGSMTRSYLEWFIAGVFSGSVMGLLGRESRDRARIRYVLPLALVLEPFAVVAVQLAGRFGGLHVAPLQLIAWLTEVVLGIAAVATRRLRSRRATTTESASPIT